MSGSRVPARLQASSAASAAAAAVAASVGHEGGRQSAFEDDMINPIVRRSPCSRERRCGEEDGGGTARTGGGGAARNRVASVPPERSYLKHLPASFSSQL